jgi:hypothetical protein
MTHARPSHAAPNADLWSWGDLFTLTVPPSLAVTDAGSAVEFVTAHPDTGEADEREASRAWLSVFSEDAGDASPGAGAIVGPADTRVRGALVRFAASHGVDLPAEAVHTTVDRGVTWGRADFEARDTTWQAIAIGWNDQLALFLVAAAPGDSAFLAALDQVLASWAPLAPVVAPVGQLRPEDDGF